MGDRSELMRLMQNLIGNAVKYHASDRRPRIEITAHREEGWLHLVVADNGIGISPEYFDKIFGIFQRLHSRANYEGTGIGLAVCKKIAEHHGGRIRVEAGKDCGVIFQLSLPVI
jgi:light-regulated signal transduction histidine kinase (bacteriophytochrome)